MKNIILLVLLISTLSLGQTTYYVSYNNGNDSNVGTSESLPWKTIARVNSFNFSSGDKILFESDNEWVGANLVIKYSGTQNSPITYSSYGNGKKPIISGRTQLPNWKEEKNWTLLKDTKDVWRIECKQDLPTSRLWLDGVEGKMAYYYRLRDDIPTGGTLRKGDNGDGTYGVCEAHPFYSDWSNGYFYLYAPSNPATYYTEILIPGIIIDDKTVRMTVDISADYITLENLDIQGSMFTSIGLNGADNILIDNCSVGKYSNWSGIWGDMRFQKDKTSEYVTISNCVVDSDWEYDYKFYTRETPYGIGAASGSFHWEIHHNLVKDWWMNIDIVAKYDASQYHNIYNNEITGPRNTFSKAIQIHAGGDHGTPPETYINFYNNYIHHTVYGIQITAHNNNFYFNIFQDLVLTSGNEHSFGSGGWASQEISGDRNGTNEKNYFFNNTFYNLLEYAQLYVGKEHLYFNNMYVNCGTKRGGIATRLPSTSSQTGTWQNNLFYYDKSTSSSDFITVINKGNFSIDQFNKLDQQWSKTISDNKQFSGSVTDLIEINSFSLPNGSPALNAGFDISEFIPEGFRDRTGNLVDRKSPNIGALGVIENSDPIKTSNGKSSLKVFLEGAYNNNSLDMTAQLKVPVSQPYSESTWQYTGNESFSNTPTNLIDWVLIELRASLDNSSYKFAALLLGDGKIVNENGLEDFSTHNISDGEYYIIVYHRNHLAIISSQMVNISNSQIIYDFSDSQSKTQGNNSMKELSNGVFGMYSGDSDANGVINNLDFGNVANNIFSSNYENGDLDLNGIINVLDYSKINSNIFKKSFVPK